MRAFAQTYKTQITIGAVVAVGISYRVWSSPVSTVLRRDGTLLEFAQKANVEQVCTFRLEPSNLSEIVEKEEKSWLRNKARPELLSNCDDSSWWVEKVAWSPINDAMVRSRSFHLTH